VGWFSRKLKDPVRGTAQVVSASSYRGDGVWQNCHLTLVVQAEGVEPFSAEWDGLVRSSRWPFPGMALPVDVDRVNPDRFEIRWKEIPSHRERAEEQADAMVEALEDGAAPGLPANVPPEAAAIVEQLTGMFPGASVVVEKPIDLRGTRASARPDGGDEDDRLAQLERLTKLRDAGALTESEFQAEKARVLGET
jgi:Short C-terminal domain